MSVLRRFERNLTAIVEGSLTRIFRSQVEVVEIARAITKEIDSHVTTSLAHKYVPSSYSVWLSPVDRKRFAEVEQKTIEELVAYSLEHARQHKLTFATKPTIQFSTDQKLGLGEFGIEVGETPVPVVVVQEEEQEQPVHLTAPRKRRPRPERKQTLLLTGIKDGKQLAVLTQNTTIGRSSTCDLVLDDSSISRKHAELRYDQTRGWTVVDLGSTNGTSHNERKISAETVIANEDTLKFGKVAVRCLLQGPNV